MSEIEHYGNRKSFYFQVTIHVKVHIETPLTRKHDGVVLVYFLKATLQSPDPYEGTQCNTPLQNSNHDDDDQLELDFSLLSLFYNLNFVIEWSWRRRALF